MRMHTSNFQFVLSQLMKLTTLRGTVDAGWWWMKEHTVFSGVTTVQLPMLQ